MKTLILEAQKIRKIDLLNNTLTDKQKALLSDILEVSLPISMSDSYVLLKDIAIGYRNRLYGK